MPISISPTGFQGLSLITAHHFNDGDFSLTKYYRKTDFEQYGLPCNYTENNVISYKKGALRGLHYQDQPSQAKLIYVVSGSIFLVALDLRYNLTTFGRYQRWIFSAYENKAIFLPELFAVGILALQDTIISFNCTGEYIQEKCRGIIWNDKELNIQWPIDSVKSPILLSEKDKNLKTFKEYRKELKGEYESQ
ncbi:MAG: dTDP-4-dehydrorhamnose 3,5-epimerase family protein [Endomicrobium sp.]|jgi:dTDP-4-dehydrorhamnose 3,5-epimerase|nr:dTDP-4-dehydrorhamnose 3,5-epimerase family protein [Endomicrobium sp.]